MMDLNGLGKWLVVLGGFLILIGAAVMLAAKIPWIGRLPGDFYIQRPNFTLYFPLATSILISVVLSLLWYFLSRR
jgi:uncharacterized protein HemY